MVGGGEFSTGADFAGEGGGGGQNSAGRVGADFLILKIFRHFCTSNLNETNLHWHWH